MTTQTQIEHWKALYYEMTNDETFMQYQMERDARRVIVRKQMLEFLNQYLSGEIDNHQFRAGFQQKTAAEWDVFGLKGFSGAMFLNMLVNNLPNQDEVAYQLHATLPLPKDIESGYHQLSSFMDYLKNLLRMGLTPKRGLQPAHAPFFVSAWWHLQNLEDWPIYYISARRAMTAEEVYLPTNEPVEDYFVFRESFVTLSEMLGLKTWELEHLCVWREERGISGTATITYEPDSLTATATIDGNAAANNLEVQNDEVDNQELAGTVDITHTQVQLLLAKLGKKLGCDVWIASNDRNKSWDGERLGDYSLETLPLYIVADPQAQRIVGLIDVLWLKSNRGVAAAFEVEHSTSIFSGLLRMSDLVTLQPNIAFPLYIVTSTTRIAEVKKQLARPTFQYLDLHKRCGFFAYEELIREFDNIMRWARTSDAINSLAEYVPDILDR